MGLGKKLEAYRIPEWKTKYVKYKAHKKFLKSNKVDIGSVGGDIAGSALVKQGNATFNVLHLLSGKSNQSFSNVARSINESFGFSSQNRFKSNDDNFGPSSVPVLRDLFQEFNERIDIDVAIIEQHFRSELNVFADRLLQIQHELESIEKEEKEEKKPEVKETDVLDSSRERTKMKKAETLKDRKERLRQNVIMVWDCIEKLEDYQKMNLLGTARIFQKRDRYWNCNRAATDFLPFRRRLNALVIADEINTLMGDMHTRTLDDKDKSGNNHMDEIHVSRAFLRESVANDQNDNITYYFLGVLTVLITNVIILFMLTPTSPNYDLDLAVSRLIPAWRLSGCVCMFSWCMAVTIIMWETYMINYKFILDVNPSFKIDATDFVGLASVQTVVWLSGMILQLADYKFNLFHNPYWGVHAICQLLAQFVIIPIWPAKDWAMEYRLSLLRGLWGCLKSIFIVPTRVSLWDNVTGDFLTSMVKPLTDAYTVLCLLRTGDYLMRTGRQKDFLIPYHVLVGAIIAVLPTWIRIQQTRGKLEANRKNPDVVAGCYLNMCKFATSVLVVIVTNLSVDRWLSPYTSRLSWVVTYLTASLFNLYWDLNRDWGLVANPDSFLRDGEKMMFPQWMYFNATCIEVLGRLTWALTLMPSTLLGAGVVSQQLVVTLCTIAEIIRRNAWLLLRIEYEHLTNSNRYRALLWVPKVQSNKNDAIRKLHAQLQLNENTTSE